MSESESLIEDGQCMFASYNLIVMKTSSHVVEARSTSSGSAREKLMMRDVDVDDILIGRQVDLIVVTIKCRCRWSNTIRREMKRNKEQRMEITL